MKKRINSLFKDIKPFIFLGVFILITALLYVLMMQNNPPAEVKGLTASAESTFVNISWEPNTEPDLWGYQIFVKHEDKGSWIPRAEFYGDARKYAIGFSINNTGYVGLGNLGGISRISELWAYYPENNSWVRKAEFGGAGRENAVSFVIGNVAYAGTGFAMNSTKDFWSYFPSNDSWVQVADFGGQSRTEAVGFSIAGKGYVGTGYSENTGCLRDFWEYNPSNNSWIRKGDFGGSPRRAAWGFVIGDKGYVGNGVCGGSFPSDFWEYDAFNDTWIRKSSSLPWGNTNYAYGFSLGGKGYVLLRESNEFWEYDAVNNSWTRMADFIGQGRFSPTGFVIGEKAYLGTGSLETTMYKDFYEFSLYDEGSEDWKQVAYTKNSYFRDTEMQGHVHLYKVRANNTANKWGDNSSVLSIRT